MQYVIACVVIIGGIIWIATAFDKETPDRPFGWRQATPSYATPQPSREKAEDIRKLNEAAKCIQLGKSNC